MKNLSNKRLLFIRFLIIFLLLLTIVQAFFLFLKVLIPIFPDILNKENNLHFFIEWDNLFFLSFSKTTPIFAFLYFFSWFSLPIVFLIKLITDKYYNVKKVKVKKKYSFFNNITSAVDKIFKPIYLEKNAYLIIGITFFLIVLLTIYPYLPSLNPLGRFVGVDIPFYEWRLFELSSSENFDIFINNTFMFPDRPLSIILLFSLWKVTWFSPQQVVIFSPVVLGLMLILSIYFFSRKAGLNIFYTSLIMLFTATSYHVTAGMYGGFIANWIYLVFMYFFWGFVFISLKSGSKISFIITLIFQTFMLFSHAGSWGMNAGILGFLFLIIFVEWIIKREKKYRYIMLLTILIIGFLLSIIRNSVLDLGTGSVEVVNIATNSISLTNLPDFWKTFSFSLGTELGSTLNNPIVFLLAAIGGIFLVFDKRLISRFLTSCTIASVIPLIFGDKIVQTRIIYNLPLHVTAALGFFILLKLIKNSFGNNSKKLLYLLFLFIVFFNVDFVFRCSLYLAQINFFPFK